MKKRPAIFSLCRIAVLLTLASCTHTPGQSSRAQALYREGQALLTQGQTEAARDRFRTSLALSREAGDRKGVAHNLNEIGILHTQEREFDQARACFREAEAIYRDLGLEAEVSKSLNNRAMTHVLDQEFPAAIKVYEELLAWDRATGNRLGQAITLTNLAHLYDARLGKPAKALDGYRQALAILDALGDEDRAAFVRERMKRLASEGLNQ